MTADTERRERWSAALDPVEFFIAEDGHRSMALRETDELVTAAMAVADAEISDARSLADAEMAEMESESDAMRDEIERLNAKLEAVARWMTTTEHGNAAADVASILDRGYDCPVCETEHSADIVKLMNAVSVLERRWPNNGNAKSTITVLKGFAQEIADEGTLSG